MTTTESAVAPLETVLTLTSNLDLSKASLSYTGPADVEFLSLAAEEYRIKITTEGFYSFTAKITGPSGRVYEDTISVVALSRRECDALLSAKWEV